MKKLFILFLFLSVLTGCNATKTASTLSSAAELKHSLKEASELLEINYCAYIDNKAKFDATEQRLLNRGFERILLARDEMNALFQSRGLDSAGTYASFIQTWGNAREGYRLIRGVLNAHDNIKRTHQVLIDQTHEKVVRLDYLIDTLTPKNTTIDYQSIATILSATASLFGTIKPLVEQR